jgi:hypothetical protein
MNCTKRLLPLLAALALCACASTSAQQAFQQSVDIAANANDAVILTTTTLFKAGTISAAQAQKVSAITQTVTTLLATANAAFTAGNAAVANADVAQANQIATQTQGCLAPGAVSGLSTCIAPITGSKSP